MPGNFVPSNHCGEAPNPQFPPGITSMAQWGRTILETGAKKDCSYSEAAEDVSYVRWILGHRQKLTHPSLKDFEWYLRMLQELTTKSGTQGIFIPGSMKPRRYKDN